MESPTKFAQRLEVLLRAINLRHGTHGFTSLLKEVILKNFKLWKNPSTLARFVPTNLRSSGKYYNHRTPGSTYTLEWMLQTPFTSQGTTVIACNVTMEGEKTGLLSTIWSPMTVTNELLTLQPFSMHILYPDVNKHSPWGCWNFFFQQCILCLNTCLSHRKINYTYN